MHGQVDLGRRHRKKRREAQANLVEEATRRRATRTKSRRCFTLAKGTVGLGQWGWLERRIGQEGWGVATEVSGGVDAAKNLGLPNRAMLAGGGRGKQQIQAECRTLVHGRLTVA